MQVAGGTSAARALARSEGGEAGRARRVKCAWRFLILLVEWNHERDVIIAAGFAARFVALAGQILEQDERAWRCLATEPSLAMKST